MTARDKINTGKAEIHTAISAPGGNASPAANDRRQNRSVISNMRDCFIEVLHRDTDPSIWIVRRWKKLLWFKKRISSDWFINRQQAFAYAHEMIKKNNRRHDIYDVKEK